MSKLRKVIAGAPDKPLIIAGIEIQCYVLEDETRVLSQAGFVRALGGSKPAGRAGRNGADNLPVFLQAKGLKPFINKDLTVPTIPIPFQPATGGGVAIGYRAETLPQVCEVYLKARDAGALLASQRHIAERAEILIRGLATVGIIALVDEVTGYQKIRARKALATILEKYIALELQPWTRTFPPGFYGELCT